MAEEHVLYERVLDNFEEYLSDAEAEQLLTYLTVTQGALRIPLLLGFVAQDRASLLFQPRFQSLLHGALFEPTAPSLRLGAADAGVGVGVGGGGSGGADRQACANGALHSLLVGSPASVLAPLCSVLRSTLATAASANYRAMHAPAVFLLGLCADVEGYAAAVARHCFDAGEQYSTPAVRAAAELRGQRSALLRLMLEQGAPLLERWRAAAAAEGDISAVLAISCCMLRVLGTAAGDGKALPKELQAALADDTEAKAANARRALTCAATLSFQLSLPAADSPQAERRAARSTQLDADAGAAADDTDTPSAAPAAAAAAVSAPRLRADELLGVRPSP